MPIILFKGMDPCLCVRMMLSTSTLTNFLYCTKSYPVQFWLGFGQVVFQPSSACAIWLSLQKAGRGLQKCFSTCRQEFMKGQHGRMSSGGTIANLQALFQRHLSINFYSWRKIRIAILTKGESCQTLDHCSKLQLYFLIC